MRGFIGLTDPDWYSYLSSFPRIDEVNFWQPHGNREFKALEPGDPFFFKLRAPHKAIAGFGFFARYESLQAWQAWDCFGEMNGAPNSEAMLNRITALRHDDTQSSRIGDFQIGCIMIAAPVFFKEQDWIAPPTDWARTGIQQGKAYSLESGEGARIFTECRRQAESGDYYWNVEVNPRVVAEGSERYGNPTFVKPRLGQGLFSRVVRDAYGGACAVTGEHSDPVLDAAHIKFYANGGEHRVDNGLFLRSDLHKLFDKGYVTVTPDNIFRVSEYLNKEFHNGRSYYGLSGSKIALPAHPSWHPNKEYLDWHRSTIFKG